MGQTLYQKLWNQHLVVKGVSQPDIVYIDLHLIHEVTSPQAFDGLREENRKVHRPDRTLGTMDHGVPTTDRSLPFEDDIAKKQVDALRKNCKDFGIKLYDLFSINQGIVHVIAPELGFTQPGQTIVCGDSHTATHGAFGTLAFGIGTSEVEHVLATQTLKQYQSKSLAVNFDGELSLGTTAKDIMLALIGKFGHDFATGYVIEYRGDIVRNLTMEERMTICNMSIEIGARAGLMEPDETTFTYVKGKPHAPKESEWDEALSEWKKLYSDTDAIFDLEVSLDCSVVEPQVTWGTNPSQVVSINDCVPSAEGLSKVQAEMTANALEYMALEAGTRIVDIAIDTVFIGSCTNSRIQDLREAAHIVRGYKVAKGLRALVVPGSQNVKKQAEEEGLAEIFINAGFEWREAGCSMCLGMNPDVAQPGERVASTSNRNFEGRQGRGARTHLVSPAMAAAAAIEGHFVDVRNWHVKLEEEVVE
ncbi:3-isopropylmalate dehydratase large subunit [Planococcus versutus]|uniref:3-isopropylmalate dehydratase large subunit n=1 Tax=Planococcus versutus TaxID=1302659 RepID=A0A1B1RZD1_9BACL|nr:3-isopropylmalate dehydratase large subunit [Planococcus versutus]ANU26300.1 3-isopropylmalate dehydratase large subunit [Planococcus versutus]